MKLFLTDHLKERLILRGISETIVYKIFEKSEEFYWDNLRKRHVVVSRTRFKGKMRKMLAAYDRMEDIVKVVTTHPITDTEIKNRLISGRWSYEKT